MLNQTLLTVHVPHFVYTGSRHGHGGDPMIAVAILLGLIFLSLPGVITYLLNVKKKGWNIFDHDVFSFLSAYMFLFSVIIGVLGLLVYVIYIFLKSC